MPRVRYRGLEVAVVQSFTLLSKVAHENLQMKNLLDLIRGQETGFERKLILLSSHCLGSLHQSG